MADPTHRQPEGRERPDERPGERPNERRVDGPGGGPNDRPNDRRNERRTDEREREIAAGEAHEVLGGSIVSLERQTHSQLTGGVWRVRAGRSTAILKVLRPLPSDVLGPLPDDVPDDHRYWLREALVYTSDVTEPYRRAGIRPPNLLARFDRAPDEIALWLEDVEGVPAPEWPLGAYGEFAERLGRAQGRPLAAGPLPGVPWLSRGFLRQFLAERDSHIDHSILHSDEAWAHPLIAPFFDASLRTALIQLHEERSRFLAWLDAVPQTFAHLDLWSSNLFDTGPAIVLIDWAFAGIGAVGEDIGNLVPDSVFDFQCPPSALEPLDRALFPAYVRGLRAAGWTGDERLIRLGMCASAVKYEGIVSGTLHRAATNAPTQRIYGGREVDAVAMFEVRAAVCAFLAGWADEARSLAAALGLA